MKRLPPRWIAVRAGFTLLEVLAALALSVLLIAAIYSGLDLYYRYSEAGRDEVGRTQVARAVLHQIERDLRGVVYHAPDASSTSTASGSTSSSTSGSSTGSGSGGGTGGTGGTGSTGSTGSTASSGSSTTTTTPQATDDAAIAATSGLFGNANTLMLHVSHPMREPPAQNAEAASHLQSRGSDLFTVSYFIGGSSSGTLQSMVKIPGLVRIQGERLAMSLADQNSNMNAMASMAQSMAPEVTAIQFRYFDGFNWRNDWDSSVFSGLPLTVEITIELAPLLQRGEGKIVDAMPTRITSIVSLPMGQPIDTSAISQ